MAKAKLVGFFLLVATIPSAAALGRVWVRQECLALGYTLSVQQQRRDALRAQIRHAELTRASGRAPSALVGMADRLGLRAPRPSQLLGAPNKADHAQP